jgi:hypothetical protein
MSDEKDTSWRIQISAVSSGYDTGASVLNTRLHDHGGPAKRNHEGSKESFYILVTKLNQ